MSNEPESRKARVDAAIAAWHEGRLEEALARLREIVAEDPKDSACLYLLGGYLWDAGRVNEAIPHLHRAVALLPGDQGASEALFNALWESGDQDGAAAVLRRFLAIRHVDEVAELLQRVEEHLKGPPN